MFYLHLVLLKKNRERFFLGKEPIQNVPINIKHEFGPSKASARALDFTGILAGQNRRYATPGLSLTASTRVFSLLPA